MLIKGQALQNRRVPAPEEEEEEEGCKYPEIAPDDFWFPS